MTSTLAAANELVKTLVVDSVSRGIYASGMDSLADRLRKILANLNISERELARRSELSHSHVNLILRQFTANPNASIEVATLEKLAKGAGTSVAYLRGETDDPSPTRIYSDNFNGGTPGSWSALAAAFRVRETCVALRAGEVTSEPVAVVTPTHVHARGDWPWPAEDVLRRMVRQRAAWLQVEQLGDDRRRLVVRPRD